MVEKKSEIFSRPKGDNWNHLSPGGDIPFISWGKSSNWQSGIGESCTFLLILLQFVRWHPCEQSLRVEYCTSFLIESVWQIAISFYRPSCHFDDSIFLFDHSSAKKVQKIGHENPCSNEFQHLLSLIDDSLAAISLPWFFFCLCLPLLVDRHTGWL